MDQQLVYRQTEGLPLKSETNTKTEFQVRSGNAIVLSTHMVGIANRFIEDRANKHGAKIAAMKLFKVTTITEEL